MINVSILVVCIKLFTVLTFHTFISLFFFCTIDEPNYWWFELAILLNKTMMCGGLVVLNPGSPTQVVCAILIMLFHLLLVLKTAPYVSYSEDWSAFASSLGLTLTYVGALIKMLKEQRRKEYDSDELNYADTAMDVLPIACVAIVVVIMIFVDCGIWNCMRGKKCSKRVQKKGESTGALTQVRPIEDDNNFRSDQHTKLRDTRLKYGADSEEYKMVVKNVQNTEKEKENKNYKK